MITEKAKNYADGKVLEALTAAVENAYTDGYKAGYNDAIEKLNNGAQELESDGVTYVDLGLPSGTLWATDCLKDKDGKTVYLSYDEAAPLNIPSKEQFEELKKICEVSLETLNVKIYNFTNNNRVLKLSYSSSYWLRDDFDTKDEYKSCISCLQLDTKHKKSTFPVILVKNKN